jgi:hypothetical protein
MMRKRWRLTEVSYSYAKALAVHIARYEQKYTGQLSTCECQETFGSWVSLFDLQDEKSLTGNNHKHVHTETDES